MPTSTRAIEYLPQFQQYDTAYDSSFRLRIDITASVNMPKEVFLYLLLPVDPNNPDVQLYKYEKVCTPPDLEDFPAKAPDPNASVPWFRLSAVDLLFRSRALAMVEFNDIVTSVDNLRIAMDLNDDLVALPSAWLGPQPA